MLPETVDGGECSMMCGLTCPGWSGTAPMVVIGKEIVMTATTRRHVKRARPGMVAADIFTNIFKNKTISKFVLKVSNQDVDGSCTWNRQGYSRGVVGNAQLPRVGVAQRMIFG